MTTSLVTGDQTAYAHPPSISGIIRPAQTPASITGTASDNTKVYRTPPNNETTSGVPSSTTITINTPTYNDVDSAPTCPRCDRTLTTHSGLAGHLRIYRTGADERVPGTPTYTPRLLPHSAHYPRTYILHKSSPGHIRIHESGIHRSIGTPNTLCTPIMSSRINTSSFSMPSTISSTATIAAETDSDDPGLSCPHCPYTPTSHISLVGHLRIYHMETCEPVSGTFTHTRRTRLHCPHYHRTLSPRMSHLGYVCIHENLR
ncbi:hypothetical protein SprV_0802580200 [Sparganum proliferum]